MTRNNVHRREVTRHIAYVLAVIGSAVTACEHASTSAPAPPGGGRTYVMSYDAFAGSIDPILSSLGCDNLNCHSGGIRGTFQLSPPNDKNPAFDFDQACLQVFPPDPAQSPLISKPLAAECGGAEHGGGAFFFSLDNPDYVAILTWIENGEYR